MSNVFRKRMKGEKGFTLIELLVVIIIIGILAAIAIPTFLGQRNKAHDAAAKSLVRNAMTAVESAYVDLKTYDPSDMDAGVLKAIEPSIVWAAKTGHVATAATAGTDESTGTGAGVNVSSDTLASENEVEYFGDATSYSIATTSASGNEFGVYSLKSGTGAGTTYVKVIDEKTSTGW